MLLGGGDCTVNEIVVEELRDCASLIVTGMDLPPVLVPLGTVALNVKVLSPETVSPCVPSL